LQLYEKITKRQINVQTDKRQTRNERVQKERTRRKGKKCKLKKEKAVEGKN
jgi:hypothetical protein